MFVCKHAGCGQTFTSQRGLNGHMNAHIRAQRKAEDQWAINVGKREFGAILAGLRFLQYMRETDPMGMVLFEKIASDCDSFKALTNKEIDAFIERINA